MEPRFVVDVNVGRLAKWLRVMGYDSLHVPDVDDEDLLRIAKKQDRIVVTRNQYIPERRAVTTGGVKVILVTSDDFRAPSHQLGDSLELSSASGFSLCIECNENLRSIAREEVRDRVPPFVFGTQDKFYECPNCGKLYWRGTHWRNMRAELAELTGEE